MNEINNMDLEKEFIQYLQRESNKLISNIEIELKKAKEYKDMLNLPSRKENWNAIENADTMIEEHYNKAVEYIHLVLILAKGMEICRNGLIYEHMMTSDKIKKREKVDK